MSAVSIVNIVMLVIFVCFSNVIKYKITIMVEIYNFSDICEILVGHCYHDISFELLPDDVLLQHYSLESKNNNVPVVNVYVYKIVCTLNKI